MKELSDNEFDRIFKKRVEESNPPFDEEAWDKMEAKLRRRNRVVFIRNTSTVLAILLFFSGAFYILFKGDKQENFVAKKEKPEKIAVPFHKEKEGISADNTPEIKQPLSARNNALRSKESSLISKGPTSPESSVSDKVNLPKLGQQTGIKFAGISQSSQALNEEVPQSTEFPLDSLQKSASDAKQKKPVNLSLAFVAGPDFNSTKSLIGKQATLNAGILLNAAFSEKLSISTGLRYGGKLYKSSAASYEIPNPELKKTITGIDGSCDVLEIPLRASYTFLDNKKRSVSINSGLSSYLMLKEKYVFKYSAESNIPNYVLEKRNANQHYFSVAEISGTYRIKSPNSKVEFGIEPYVKIPLGGVGEGKVHLKSSGITLNMFYDLSKKNPK